MIENVPLCCLLRIFGVIKHFFLGFNATEGLKKKIQDLVFLCPAASILASKDYNRLFFSTSILDDLF